MKKSIVFAAVCAIAAIGCTKNEVESAKGAMVPISMEIGVPSTKVALNAETYAQTWESGDKIAIWSYYGGSYTNNLIELTANGSGAICNFTGEASAEFASATDSRNFVISPRSAITFYQTTKLYLTVPATQTGKLSDFGKYAIAYTMAPSTENYGLDKFLQSDIKLLNLTPVLKFNIAPGNDVRKIVISGYMNGTQEILAAQMSDGKAIYMKPGSNQIYQTSSSVKDITIQREDSEEISGDVYVVLAPNFPQSSDLGTGRQWDDGKYDINGTGKIPYNTCDELKFVFYNSSESKVEFSKKLKKAEGERFSLKAGTISDFGTISALPFPAPKIKLEISSTGNLCCNASNALYSYVYEMTTDGSTPADPTVSSELFPSEGLALADTAKVYEVNLKIGQVRSGAVINTKNALLRKFIPKSEGVRIEVYPGESKPFGFFSFNNFFIDSANHTNEICAVLDDGYAYYCYALDAEGFATTTEYAATGESTSKPFKASLSLTAKHAGADCTLYALINKGRRITLKYVEGDNVIKSSSGQSASHLFTVGQWQTDPDLQVKTVNGGGTVTVFAFTCYTPYNGTAWLEQGFKSF